MGDMAEDFQFLKEQAAKRRADRIAVAKTFEDQFIAAGLTKLNDYHWVMDLLGDRLQYWPSNSRWNWRNKTRYGGPGNLLNFIQKRGEGNVES